MVSLNFQDTGRMAGIFGRLSVWQITTLKVFGKKLFGK